MKKYRKISKQFTSAALPASADTSYVQQCKQVEISLKIVDVCEQ